MSKVMAVMSGLASLLILCCALTLPSQAASGPPTNMPRGFEWSYWGMSLQELVAVTPIELHPIDTDFYLIALRVDLPNIKRPSITAISAILSGRTDWGGQTMHVRFAFDGKDQLAAIAMVPALPWECKQLFSQWYGTVGTPLQNGSGIWIKRKNGGKGTQIDFISNNSRDICRIDFSSSNVLY